MANFKTHLGAASGMSVFSAIIMFGAKLASPESVLLYFSLGTVAGILPDVDSDTSVPLKIIFNVFAVFFSFLAMFSQISRYSIIELLLLWAAVYIAIRYLIFKLFTRFTKHRGLFHSIPAALFFALLSPVIFHHIFKIDIIVSWMSGFFVFLGYMTHLVLDEIYSVDLSNIKLKRSFGTACTLISFKQWKAYTLLYLIVIAMYFVSPAPQKMMQHIFRMENYQHIKTNFLPQNKWFENMRFWE